MIYKYHNRIKIFKYNLRNKHNNVHIVCVLIKIFDSFYIYYLLNARRSMTQFGHL